LIIGRGKIALNTADLNQSNDDKQFTPPMTCETQRFTDKLTRTRIDDHVHATVTVLLLDEQGRLSSVERGGAGLSDLQVKYHRNGVAAYEFCQPNGFRRWLVDGSLKRDTRRNKLFPASNSSVKSSKLAAGGIAVDITFEDSSAERYTFGGDRQLVSMKRMGANGVHVEATFWAHGVVASVDQTVVDATENIELFRVRNVFDRSGNQIFREYLDFLGNHKLESWTAEGAPTSTASVRGGTQLRRERRYLENGMQIQEESLEHAYHKSRYMPDGTAIILDQDLRKDVTRLIEFDPGRGVTLTESSPEKFEQWTWDLADPNNAPRHECLLKQSAAVE
jgi:hypothetical protein